MNDYSIELSAERIFDARTKRYFAEVHGCYAAGYYRSAVVMLWSVVVTDIMFKLDQLATAYSDATAQAILSEIGSSRTNNPKSPEWESELITKVAGRTDLLDHAEVSFLQSLQVHRHLSAHPVIGGEEALFAPNRETARAHIRNVLDSVLTKPPIMSRKVFDAFIEDLEQLGKLSPEIEGIRTFLEAKYLRFFSEATFVHVFRSLWRVTFKAADARADVNRELNSLALLVLFSKKTLELTAAITADRDRFSDVSFTQHHIDAMSRFFVANPQVFPLLTDALKTPLVQYADQSFDAFAPLWFTSSNPKVHIEAIRKRMAAGEELRPESVAALCGALSTSDDQPEAFQIGIDLYFGSGSYDSADARFQIVIRPFLAAYRREDFTAFLAACEQANNGQVTGRSRARRDHLEIKAAVIERFPSLKLDAFPVFEGSL